MPCGNLVLKDVPEDGFDLTSNVPPSAVTLRLTSALTPTLVRDDCGVLHGTRVSNARAPAARPGLPPSTRDPLPPLDSPLHPPRRRCCACSPRTAFPPQAY